MAAIDKAAAKQAPRPHEDVPTPELGEGAFIRVRCLTALARDEYETGFWAIVDDPSKPGGKRQEYSAVGARGRLLHLSCEWLDTGERFFETAAEANGFRADVADRLFDVAQRISGLNKELDALKKIFDAIMAGASSTSSPKS